MEIAIPQLIFSLLLCYSVAFLGGIVTYPSLKSWYEALHKPFFTPPNWVFGPVWTLLYTFMGISLYIIWSTKVDNTKRSRAIGGFGLQLLLNFLWTYIFFGLHFPLIALFVIGGLLWMIVFTIRRFFPIAKVAAYLLFPYLIWVAYATLLNLGIVFLN